MIGSYNIAADVGVAIACSLQGAGGMKERLCRQRSFTGISAETQKIGHHGNTTQLLEAELVIWDLAGKSPC